MALVRAAGVVPLLGLVDLVDGRAQGRLVGVAELVLVLLEQLLELVDALLGGVPGLGQLALRLSSLACDSASRCIRSISSLLRPPDDSILIVCSLPVPLSRAVTLRMPLASMLKVDLDLRHAHPRRGDALEVEVAEEAVVAGHRPLALVDLDRSRRLVVLGGREDLLLLGRDRRVARDERGHHAALGLEAERQRGDVEQEDFLDVAGQRRRPGWPRRRPRPRPLSASPGWRAAVSSIDGSVDRRRRRPPSWPR